MSNYLVTVQTSLVTLDAGVTLDRIEVDVTDSTGNVFSQSLTGSETPPYTGTFALAEGAGSMTARNMSPTGIIGSPVGPVAFDTANLGGGTGTQATVATGLTIARAP
jgi:hypothetical protein